MKKVIMVAAMAALIPVSSVYATGEADKPASQGTYKTSSDRLDMEHEREKMSAKMSHKGRGTMFNSTAKRSSDRLQGKREQMAGKMDSNKHGAMRSSTLHEHGHRIEESNGMAE